ncbi:MAG: hypothetical protein ACF8XB_05820 [Planctomycetota bacterium JB042]
MRPLLPVLSAAATLLALASPAALGQVTLTPSIAFSTHDEPVDGLGDSFNPSFPGLIRTQSSRADRAMQEFPLASLSTQVVTGASISGKVHVNNAFDNGPRTFDFFLYAGNGQADLGDHQIPGLYVGSGSYHPPNDSSFTFTFGVAAELETILATGASHVGLKVIGTSNPNFPNVLSASDAKLQVQTSGAVPVWTDLGLGLAGTHGVPPLGGTGIVTSVAPLTMNMMNGLPGATAFLITGPTAVNAPFFGGTLVPFPQFILPTIVPNDGAILLTVTTPPAVPAGVPIHVQYWIQDPAAPQGLAASNAVVVTTQ